MLTTLAFHRANLAQAYCDSLEGKGIAHSTSGLFLAGPRRVGKSTFLIEDLIPETKKRHWLPVYVDLWSNKLADPALLIIEALKSNISKHTTKLSQITKRIKLSKVNILKAVELDFSKPGLPDNITMVDLLDDLVRLSQMPVVLIIDEAQHALITEKGLNSMFSIKSARDQINTSRHSPQLMLVFTGSSRDKLAQLVLKKEQPFFGSEVTTFPLLGRDYTDFFTKKVNDAMSHDNQFSEEVMWQVFKLTGHRPEILCQIVGRTALSHQASSFSELLKQDALSWHSEIGKEFENEISVLTSLQRTILALLIEKGRTWLPFSEESMDYYRKSISQKNLSSSSVQTAIHSLRERGFIWQSSRGSYALEDESFAEWFKRTKL